MTEHPCTNSWSVQSFPVISLTPVVLRPSVFRYGVSCVDAYTVTNLELKSNNLSGSLPVDAGTFLYRLTNLTKLTLDENALTGSIPAAIEGLNNLVTVTVSNNSLCGLIPVWPGSVVTKKISGNPSLGETCGLAGLRALYSALGGPEIPR